MAQIANIVLNDAQATPVAHTFGPARTPVDGALWEDRSAAQYIGYNKVTMELKRPTGSSGGSANRNLKAIIRVETPKLENVTNSTVSGIAPAPTVSYRPMAELTFTFPERCSLQDRKDLQKYILQLMSNTFVTDLVEKFEVAF